MNTPSPWFDPADSKVLQILEGLQGLPAVKKKGDEALFRQVYPGVQAALDLGVSRKEIIASLMQQGLKLHAQRFRKLLEAEHSLRSASDGFAADPVNESAESN